MIAVVDTGGANIASVGYALQRLGCQWALTQDKVAIESASHVILPGVGAAADSMARLAGAGLVEAIPKLTQPVLGICLGMQLLFESSQEGDVSCLGIIPGRVARMHPQGEQPLVVPHMGWNRVSVSATNPLVQEPAYFYFVHSFQAPAGEHVLADCDYGGKVPAVVGRKNFWGCQFHPERSADAGADVLKRFVGL